MKASELRIGNLLEWNLYTVKVIELNQTDVGIICVGDCVYPNDEYDILPISLTKDLMILLGFKKTDNNLWIKKTKAGRIFKVEEADGCIKKDIGFGVSEDGYRMIQIYLHQLQNLYFALTGEELTNEELTL